MKNIDRLAQLLEQEKDAYSEILQVEREKEEAITANEPEKLLEALRREEPIVEKANSLEQEILACRDALAAQAGKPCGVSLREIIARLAAPGSDELEKLRVSLLGFAEEIRHINQTNYLLLKQSIELLDEVVSAILGEAAPCNTYEGNGRIEPAAGRQATLSIRA